MGEEESEGYIVETPNSFMFVCFRLINSYLQLSNIILASLDLLWCVWECVEVIGVGEIGLGEAIFELK